MKIKCLLVDDEPPALEILESYINTVDGLEIEAKCHSAIQAFGILKEKQIDLIFLDVKMPMLTGTNFLRALKDPPKVIFTTAYRDFAVEGFELEAIDYLMKPVSIERFLKAVSKVIPNKNFQDQEKSYQPNKEAFLYFKCNRKMIKVLIDDILFIESLKDYVKIYVDQYKDHPLIVKQTITSLEAMLPISNFLRIHRSYIVSTNKILSFTSTHIQIGKDELPIGRLFGPKVFEMLGGFNSYKKVASY